MSGSAITERRTGPFDRKLEHVLASAAQVIAREGYGRATIRQVAGEAGLSLAGLYHYVASKDELLFLIQFHTFDSIVRELGAKARAGSRPAGAAAASWSPTTSTTSSPG